MQSLLRVVLIACLILTYLQPANAVERKKQNWLASCPEVIDSTPQLPTPKTVFLRSPSGQPLKLLAKDSVEFVTEPQSIIGCYVFEEYVINVNTSPAWQIGALNRDSNGYYFRNQAGITWRLKFNPDTLILETEPGSLYYSQGSGFGIDQNLSKAADCKVKDFFMGYTRIGFPRNPSRLPQFGTTKNLILVVDFPDAVLSENLNTIVEDVIAPRVVENFFSHSSNGKFNPTFDVFPKVIRLNSLEKSFAPNSTGGFFVNGVQQDHRLVQEAVGLAITQGNLDSYESINVFAPTANSMGYYGSAFMGLPLKTGSKTIINSQLVGGTIGTVRSGVPSWKVFAHEYGHLLGMHDYYIQGTGSSGKSPGPFDIMGNTIGGANSFFGFQRWVQGWLEDSEVICDFTIDSMVSHTLNPLNQKSGKKLYVHPIDGSTAMVVEFRTETEVDSLKGNDGLLVYLIDMTVGSLKGPVSIQPSEQDLVLNPRDDVERYLRAPLSSGQSVRVKNLVVLAEEVSKDRAMFKVLTSTDYQAKVEADALAASELKAKLEAAAIAAAKLVAEAKVEAERRLAAVKVPTIKKSTITCVKGKLIKKVTTVKPKCPSGYKVKR